MEYDSYETRVMNLREDSWECNTLFSCPLCLLLLRVKKKNKTQRFFQSQISTPLWFSRESSREPQLKLKASSVLNVRQSDEVQHHSNS